MQFCCDFVVYLFSVSLLYLLPVSVNVIHKWLPCWERAGHLVVHVCCKNIVVLFCPLFPAWCLGGNFDFN